MSINLYMPLDNTVPSALLTTGLALIQAGEVGVLLNIYPYLLPIPISPVSLSTANCVLAVIDPYSNLTSLSLTVDSSGIFAYRNTLTTDFIFSGLYEIQLIATYSGDTLELKSPIQSFIVGLTLE
jgi:hypothetical protein